MNANDVTSTFEPFKLSGEVDMATARELHFSLDAYVATSEGEVVLDCSDLDFLDASVLAVLVQVYKILLEYGRSMRLVNVSGAPLRALEITALVEPFRVNDVVIARAP